MCICRELHLVISHNVKEYENEYVYICITEMLCYKTSAVFLEPPQNKSVTVSIVSPFICYEVMGLDAMILVF